jgi:hypothetical protein
LRGLGARLWRAHLLRRDERRAERRAQRRAGGEPEPQREREWKLENPEQVVRRLEGTVLHFAHRLRRGRWLLRLAESTLRWRPSTRSADGPARLLHFERGRLEREEDVGADGALPVPAGADRSRAERRTDFDAATYDRLRVLTTELRRLVLAEADVVLCLGPRLLLDRTALARRLFWV